LAVRDDGVGFDPNEMRPGMGLANLKERARRLGGEMAVMSETNQGTTVEAVIPLS
jgi:signal transduction histidine kinase